MLYPLLAWANTLPARSQPVKQYLPTPAVDSSAALAVQQFVWWHAISTRHSVCWHVIGWPLLGHFTQANSRLPLPPPPLLVQSPGKLAIIKQEDNNLPANLPACVFSRCRATTHRENDKQANAAEAILCSGAVATHRAQAQPWLIKNDYRRQISMRLMSLVRLLAFGRPVQSSGQEKGDRISETGH